MANEKHGRSKRSPSKARYDGTDRKSINKMKRVRRQLERSIKQMEKRAQKGVVIGYDTQAEQFLNKP